METTDKKEGFYLTVSESGIPIRLDWPRIRLPENVLQNLFIEYVNIEVQIASKAGYIPDNRVQRYDLPDKGHLMMIIDDLWQGKSILDLIPEHGAVKKEDISFRAAYFHDQNMERISPISLPAVKKISDGMFNDPLLESVFTEFNDDCKLKCHTGSYMTEKGIVSFDNSWFGETYKDEYLKHLADHYFDPKRGTGDQLKVYTFYHPNKEQIEHAVNIYKHFNILNLNSIPEIPLSQDLSLLTNPSKENRWSLGHNYDDYRHFIEDFNLESTPANKIIHDLLYIKEIGYPRYHDSVDQKVRTDFQHIETPLIDLHANDPHNDKLLFELLNKSQVLADTILKERYKIEGKPFVLRNSEQIFLSRKGSAKNRNENKKSRNKLS